MSRCTGGRPALDLEGLRFGKLTVMHRVPSKAKSSQWRCKCDCGNEVVRYGGRLSEGSSCGCDTSKRSGENHYNWKGGTWVDVHGYELTRVNGKVKKVHRLVMEEKLGRPLRQDENVHHINGVRDDNRPENLEIWVTSQPSGQRPADLVSWAKEILERYENGT